MMCNGKTFLSADEYLRDIWRLSAAVRQADWRPDLLIALWRGGAPVGVAVHEFLKATGWSVRHMPVKCASYTGVGRNDGGVAFEQEASVFDMVGQGEKVLVVDDVFDTGKTAAAVKSRLDRKGAEMRTACVYWKSPRNLTALVPDYFAKDVGSDWIVFPHELEGLAKDEIAEKDSLLATLL